MRVVDADNASVEDFCPANEGIVVRNQKCVVYNREGMPLTTPCEHAERLIHRETGVRLETTITNFTLPLAVISTSYNEDEEGPYTEAQCVLCLAGSLIEVIRSETLGR